MPTVLTIAGVVLRDAEGRMLTVRKSGTTMFMLPGGKLETGEASDEAATRELAEELGIEVPAASLRLLGSWRATAANEPDTVVESTIYCSDSIEEPMAAAEIAELVWMRLDEASEYANVAPLLRLHVVPTLLALVRH
ncbi:NUDIX hydrolase [Arthrobacter castelli]|uniref:NUDIX hydrolase n=1 Tax=Arthrobacter castelli TaxID=271431 RepID=UPI0003FA5C73|nr:NUDIX domain-containing protein [Arthrobacter castelli]